MKSAGKARSNGLYRHIRTSKEIIRNLLNDYKKNSAYCIDSGYGSFCIACQHIFKCKMDFHTFIVENLDAVNKGFYHIL